MMDEFTTNWTDIVAQISDARLEKMNGFVLRYVFQAIVVKVVEEAGMWSLAQQVDEEEKPEQSALVTRKMWRLKEVSAVETLLGLSKVSKELGAAWIDRDWEGRVILHSITVQNPDEYPSLQYQVMEVNLYLDDWWLVFEHPSANKGVTFIDQSAFKRALKSGCQVA
ncbi:hypothetical protein F2Q69_00017595 [Brassica cretica]|uniref:Uncharacterized protein n=1 Tax=Brassica cretica TaxID=69181 RepID=A0A8S9QY18_BRACR|nr:hypothetical protein F2Q69_00017595 [Brassica cretica]